MVIKEKLLITDRGMLMKAQFFYKDINAPKPNRPNHIGTSVIIEFENNILLEARTDSDTWAIIGGGLKVEESLQQCAIREVREETGIILKSDNMELYKIYDDPTRIASYPDGNILRVITVVYKIILEEYPQLICSNESKELKFFSKEELKSLEIAKTHIPIIEDYLGENV